MKINELEPKIVWKYFDEITRIPRPSKKEEKIIAYIEDVAAKAGIPVKKDAAGNLLLTKPATKGFEDRPTVILQAHLDMVCEKNSDVVHDFDNDPIKTVVDGDWLRAQGTTLGADNGIGLAAALAVVMSDDIEHGKIECLFTVDEETGLTGANALQSGFMTGKILLNLDSEDEGQIFIGCAGGKGTIATFKCPAIKADDRKSFFRVGVSGLKGGHSGCDIEKGRGNANKILARFLYAGMKNFDNFGLSTIKGGNLHNAIPREASAVIGIMPEDREQLSVALNVFAADIANELKKTDPDVKITLESVEMPQYELISDNFHRLVYALLTCPHGVISMSRDIDDLVETSTNLASVKMADDDKIIVETSQRSSIESAKQAIGEQVEAVFRFAGAEVTFRDGYPGWAPNPDSKILKVALESYRRLFGKDAEIKAIHAGLECGLFMEKYPDLDMISFGPTLYGVHSPDERIEIPTVGMWWQHLLDVLRNV
ncbi:MAG: aminoacyl-histidine dipeptidase [Tannerella sp.]|jgi:dipeptidase D|nr:aminoacyl-histidine dipeptidase [Tannerella sp.]